LKKLVPHSLIGAPGTSKWLAVMPEHCIGCGACEHSYPVKPLTAIRVQGNIEHRRIKKILVGVNKNKASFALLAADEALDGRSFLRRQEKVTNKCETIKTYIANKYCSNMILPPASLEAWRTQRKFILFLCRRPTKI
jgi:ferredoxin